MPPPGQLDEEALQDLYGWVDAIPLSRPKRNLARDFSDGDPSGCNDLITVFMDLKGCPMEDGAELFSVAPEVLAAEVVKFYFPKMVEMHNYVPANSTQQKLSNWAHLNRKVLNKLNFSIPEDVIRKIAQCSPGVVELVLIPLRQKIEEKQKQAKVTSSSYQELGMRSTLEESNYLDTGYSSKPQMDSSGPSNQESPGSEKGTKGQLGQADSTLRLHLAEREQALLACQETVQILQLKIRRLEHLLHLKNVRIDNLSRKLQEVEKKRK